MKRKQGGGIADLIHSLTGQDRASVVARMIDLARASPCTDCGMQFAPEIMEFDHVYGPRSFTLTRSSPFSVELVRSEIAKCEIRCPNCHRRRHYRDRHPNWDDFALSGQIPGAGAC